MGLVRLVAHAVLRQRLIGELDRQRLGVESDGRVFLRKPMLPVCCPEGARPVPEPDIAQYVESPAEARPVEEAVQFLRRDLPRREGVGRVMGPAGMLRCPVGVRGGLDVEYGAA